MHKDAGNPLLLVNREAGHSHYRPRADPVHSSPGSQPASWDPWRGPCDALGWVCPDHENQDSGYSEIRMKTIKEEEELISLSSKQMGKLRKELRGRVSREKLGHAVTSLLPISNQTKRKGN
jgi:hypothetical protein